MWLQTQSQVAQLRDEGNKLFGRKEYAKALETYDKALKTVAPGSSDVALLHSNKAACHMMGKRWVACRTAESLHAMRVCCMQA